MITTGTCQGFSAQELQRLQDAVSLANRIMSTDEFKQRVLAHTRLDGCSGFDESDQSTQSVYDAVTGKDITINCSIIMPGLLKRAFSKECAHENADGSVVFDRNKYSREDGPSLANTVAHEACHVAGFTHTYEPSAARDNSVPYGIGNIVEQLARAG